MTFTPNETAKIFDLTAHRDQQEPCDRVVTFFHGYVPLLGCACVEIIIQKPIESEVGYFRCGIAMYDHAFYALNLQEGDKICFKRTGQNIFERVMPFMQEELYELVCEVEKIDPSPITTLVRLERK